mmetsp:Transcript_41841/g.90298  ORF Transcript_41841/g.90298 Transcript_41841/m.90298 type:complete len:699 (+) Transcript_41841:138-2234(+)|eukprot:CAMPEP_0206545802 /NCGR_PEP_ID=MMETSP0325_2-20121206/12342_1 /ASSEMBLY_ACC=CAM_ASM_000347 /TAXON_ID=2866 /ORGANISM="Crypthecodinium cohnii, Strain Seligo" /LENGTH=698 /DNA_ID=CAMNT_0054044835 /DNA_START=63 /DNA_END=2159 /DNA_ORIENTATION=-
MAAASGLAEVTVKGLDPDSRAVVVNVHPKCTLLDVKQAVGDALDRPEVMELGRFVMMTPNEEVKDLLDTQKLGPRRNLLLEGIPLFPKSEERPAWTVENFNPKDEECLLETPRSIKACDIEGVDPEELFYVPRKAFSQPGLAKRLAQLRHDFFEAFRQDTVEIVKRARMAIMEEDFGVAIGRITRQGGNWGGALSPQMYPHTHALLEDLRIALTVEKVYERPKALPGKPPHINKWAPAGETHWDVDADKPAHIMDYLASEDADLDDDMVEWACEDCANNLKQLMRLPAGNGEQVEGLPKRSQNMVVAQIPNDAAVLKKQHKSLKKINKAQAGIADSQIVNVHWKLEEVKFWREKRVDRFRDSQESEVSPLSQSRRDRAVKQEEYWLKRRRAVHEAELWAEDDRNEKLRARAIRETERERRVANIISLSKVHFARTWTDRRASWGRNHLAVDKGTEVFNAGILHKHEEAEARVEDQRLRRQAWIEYRREIKVLRKALSEMAAEREERKQNMRRQALAEEFKQMAEEAEVAHGTARNLWGSGSNRTNLTHRSGVNWMSQSTGSLPGVRGASGGGAFSSTGRSDLTSLPHSRGSPTTRGGGGASRRKGPRFDWGAFGAEAIANPPPSRSFGHRSLSDPFLSSTGSPTNRAWGAAAPRAVIGIGGIMGGNVGGMEGSGAASSASSSSALRGAGQGAMHAQVA